LLLDTAALWWLWDGPGWQKAGSAWWDSTGCGDFWPSLACTKERFHEIIMGHKI
jgi:hypothetical protein